MNARDIIQAHFERVGSNIDGELDGDEADKLLAALAEAGFKVDETRELVGRLAEAENLLRDIVELIHMDDWITGDYFTDNQTDSRYERKKAAVKAARAFLKARGGEAR